MGTAAASKGQFAHGRLTPARANLAAMILLWVGVMVVGLGLALAASRRAVESAMTLAVGTRIPPFLLGITLFAVGTDLPEIANSVVSSVSGHGELNVGDSLGSVVVQSALVLGLLPLLAGAFRVGRSRIGLIGATTLGALAVVAVLVGDGTLGRAEGLGLIGLWLAGSLLIGRHLPSAAEPAMVVPDRHPIADAGIAVAGLLGVVAGASLAVAAFVRIAALLGVPEFAVGFFLASIGTSLPELVVTVTALRGGARDLALGDVLGASFVDATLSIGIGPVFRTNVFAAALAVRAALAAGLVTLVVVALFRARPTHDWRTGLVLLATYAAALALVAL